MFDPRAQLEDDQRLTSWLGQMYRSDVLGVGDHSGVTKIVKERLEADQRLRQAADRRIAELEPICSSRDQKSAFIEHKQLEYLRKVTAP